MQVGLAYRGSGRTAGVPDGRALASLPRPSARRPSASQLVGRQPSREVRAPQQACFSVSAAAGVLVRRLRQELRLDKTVEIARIADSAACGRLLSKPLCSKAICRVGRPGCPLSKSTFAPPHSRPSRAGSNAAVEHRAGLAPSASSSRSGGKIAASRAVADVQTLGTAARIAAATRAEGPKDGFAGMNTAGIAPRRMCRRRRLPPRRSPRKAFGELAIQLLAYASAARLAELAIVSTQRRRLGGVVCLARFGEIGQSGRRKAWTPMKRGVDRALAKVRVKKRVQARRQTLRSCNPRLWPGRGEINPAALVMKRQLDPALDHFPGPTRRPRKLP